VEWQIIGLNFIYAVLGVVLMFVSYRAIDRLTPQVDFPAELKKGNLAVGLVIASIFIGIAMIVAGALN
jgi:putative membrane protein